MRVIAGLVLVAGLAGCGGENENLVPGADPDRGKAAIADYGCGTCHTIPGVRSADGKVGPPLIDFAERAYIAGRLPNTPSNLIRWISSPQSVEPGTVMPDVGASTADVRNIASYLYSLGSPDRSSRLGR